MLDTQNKVVFICLHRTRGAVYDQVWKGLIMAQSGAVAGNLVLNIWPKCEEAVGIPGKWRAFQDASD